MPHTIKFVILFLATGLISSCAGPIAKFIIEPGEKVAPAAVKFENQSEKAESYEWDFGDEQKSEEASPKHTYKASGNYVVTLKAKKGKKKTIMQQNVHVDAPENCLVEVETDFGTMTILLYDATPGHRDNFIKLAEEGFYDGLLFHRVIPGFMIQGGDPDSKDAKPGQALGSGGPGYQIPAEFVDTLAHVKGAVAAARTGDQINPKKKSSGSQFYIVQGRTFLEKDLESMEAQKGITYTPEQRKAYMEQGGTPFLDQNYTVFGQVINGLDVLDKIAGVATSNGDRPKEDIKMKIQVIK